MNSAAAGGTLYISRYADSLGSDQENAVGNFLKAAVNCEAGTADDIDNALSHIHIKSF